MSGEMESTAARCPLVSVIIPAYNMAGYIGESLASVWAQTFTDFEVIVVNDGSPDTEALEAALAPWRERIVYLTQPNAGPSRARNTALRAARGEYVSLLDADDQWTPDHLAVQMEILLSRPEVDVVYPNGVIFGDSPIAGREHREFCPSVGEVTFRSLAAGECNVMVNITARRRAVEQAGLFDEELRWCEDFDLWLRMAHQGSRFVYHSRVLVRVRRHAESASADGARMIANQIRVLDKMARVLPLDAEDRAVVAARRARCQAELRLAEGRRAFLHGNAGEARQAVREANQYFGNPRLRVADWLLGVCPGVLRGLYRWRHGV